MEKCFGERCLEDLGANGEKHRREITCYGETFHKSHFNSVHRKKQINLRPPDFFLENAGGCNKN